jgi:hypothetical protein
MIKFDAAIKCWNSELPRCWNVKPAHQFKEWAKDWREGPIGISLRGTKADIISSEKKLIKAQTCSSM